MKTLLTGIAFALLLAGQSLAYDSKGACKTIEEASQDAVRMGGQIVDIVDVPSTDADQLLIADVGGIIQVWGVKAGCMVFDPVPTPLMTKPIKPATPA